MYVIPVGSIALDGISLTVARLEDDFITVALIPHTLTHTAAGENWQPGAAVNLEFDLIGKYVARWMETRSNDVAGAGASRLDEAWMKEQGF